MNVLVTGGAGYIGSHTVVELIKANHDVVVVDDFSNSSPEVFNRLKAITGKDINSYKVDITDLNSLEIVFQRNKFDSVIHFAGKKAVGESSIIPIDYYHNNVTGSLNLLRLIDKHRVKSIVFSSSATVYGEKNPIPYKETMFTSASNPYGRTKLVTENIIKDYSDSNKQFNAILLRYFNPIGAHESGLIGEDPQGIPNNLLPYISQVAVQRREKLSIYGGDYPTIDGTGVRDYIHVMDLARGHVMAMETLFKNNGVFTYNLGTGTGTSVLEIVEAFEDCSGMEIPYDIVERRKGDLAEFYADCSLARDEINWVAKKNLSDMISDTWNWQSQNPNGYDKNN